MRRVSLGEIKIGGVTYRRGDRVIIERSAPGKQDRREATFRDCDVMEDGRTWATVFILPHRRKPGYWRTVELDRLRPR